MTPLTLARGALMAATLLTAHALAAEATTDTAAARPAPVSIVDTAAPGGIFGLNGFDVYVRQRVAARFTVPATGDHRLARVGIWFFNNSGTEQPQMRITVQTDALDEGGSDTLPSGRRLATWVAPVATLGWDPVEQFFTASAGNAPRLKAGRSYWVVAESAAPAGADPVWAFARSGLGVSTTTFEGAWQPAGEGGAITLRVDAVPID
jgi:hypothetical protein